MKRHARLPSPGLLVAIVALIAALSGAAIALPGKGKVDSGDLKKGAVTKKALKKGAVTKKAIKAGAVVSKGIADGAVTEAKLADGAVTGPKVADESLSSAKLSDLLVVPTTKVNATSGATEAAARAAAPETELFSKAGLTVYAKCFTDLSGPTVHAEIIVRTNANGALLEGSDILPSSDELLNTSTLEEDRTVAEETESTLNEAGYQDQEYLITAADGTAVSGVLGSLAKRGDLPTGNGQLNAGDSCLFNGHAVG